MIKIFKLASEPSIVNICRIADKNIGDQYSTPFRHLSFSCKSSKMIDPLDTKLNSSIIDGDYSFIIGGGGILVFNKIIERVVNICKINNRLLIGWGLGVNDENSTVQVWPKYLEKFDLLGIRDPKSPYGEYVPCVSCLSRTFDKYLNPEIKYKKILYKHHKVDTEFDKSLPLMTNDGEFEETIRFLSSAETVYTNSFHGAYWSMLLGKNVVYEKWSSKFYSLPLTTPSDYLVECRDRNFQFIEKLSKLLNINICLK
jgi:hypothetical protein